MPRASRAHMAWPLSKVVFGLMRLISADQACGCRAVAAPLPRSRQWPALSGLGAVR
jgi:hypothetical protein